MVKKPQRIPDAWDDDDFETQADTAANAPSVVPKQPEEPVRLSKPERIALHRESNRKLWESAETPETFHFLEAAAQPPLATAYKPPVKVLSRKPILARRDPATAGMSGLSLNDDDDDDDDEEDTARKNKMSDEERALHEKTLLEEKQRAYEAARRRIFGDEEQDTSGSSKGDRSPSRTGGGRGRGRGGSRGSSRGRGAGRGNGGSGRNSPARGGEFARPPTAPGMRELYDPNYSPRPTPSPSDTSGSPARQAQAPAVREPRGPDGSGRGGFGFTRGARIG